MNDLNQRKKNKIEIVRVVCKQFWPIYLGRFRLDCCAKGPFLSENLMGLKKICQITILNLNF